MLIWSHISKLFQCSKYGSAGLSSVCYAVTLSALIARNAKRFWKDFFVYTAPYWRPELPSISSVGGASQTFWLVTVCVGQGDINTGLVCLVLKTNCYL